MKKILTLRSVLYFFFGIVLSLLPLSPACATDGAGTTSSLDDSKELPSSGVVTVQTYYSYGSFNSDVQGFTGNRSLSTDTTQHTFGTNISYSFTDRFSMHVSGSYSPSYDQNITSASFSPRDRNASGFLDPTIGASYRTLTQQDHYVYLDALVDYTPDLVAAQKATVTQDGSLGQGGQEVEFGFEVGRTLNNGIALSLRATGVYDDTQTIQTPTGTANTGPQWGYNLALDAQTYLTDRLWTSAGLGYSPGTDRNTGSNGNVFTPGDTANVNVGLGYDIVPTRFSAAVNYAHSFALQNSTYNISQSNQNLTVQNKQGNVITVNFTYAFKP